MKQFIYITGSTETNIFKIGLSSNPEQRVKNINGSSNQKNDNWDSIPIPAHLAHAFDDIYGFWLTPPSYYYPDEKNLLILETRLAILEDIKSHITKFINEQQSSK